jgi:hypothetical protein
MRLHPYAPVALLALVLNVPTICAGQDQPVGFQIAATPAFAPSGFVGTAEPSQEPAVPDTGATASAPAQTPDNPAPDNKDTTALGLPRGDEPHPPAAHTGFRALFSDTIDDFKAFPRRRSTWVILGIGAATAAAVHPADDHLNGHLGSNRAGDFFSLGKWTGAAYTQAAASLGLYFTGRYLIPAADGTPRTNKVSHLGLDLLRAQILSQAMVHGMKYAVRRDRPTGECCSFPSGHAATAFAAASVLERHLGYRAAWPTLLIATYVGASRLHDNRHFVSDVAFGSAIGMVTGWTVVGRHGRSNYALVPTPVPGGVVLTVQRQLGAE